MFVVFVHPRAASSFSTQYLTANATIIGGAPTIAAPIYCHQVVAFFRNLLIRANGTYPLPYGFSVSANSTNATGVQKLRSGMCRMTSFKA